MASGHLVDEDLYDDFPAEEEAEAMCREEDYSEHPDDYDDEIPF